MWRRLGGNVVVLKKPINALDLGYTNNSEQSHARGCGPTSELPFQSSPVMVHVRLNERETNPNPHVNFITTLPFDDEDEARQLLRALAAQVRPIMKRHGFAVNSFEEVGHNTKAIFADAHTSTVRTQYSFCWTKLEQRGDYRYAIVTNLLPEDVNHPCLQSWSFVVLEDRSCPPIGL